MEAASKVRRCPDVACRMSSMGPIAMGVVSAADCTGIVADCWLLIVESLSARAASGYPGYFGSTGDIFVTTTPTLIR